MIGSVLRIALLQLARNKGRTALTSLGILIGVAAVIAMVSIGSGATAAVEQDLSGLGQNLLFVTPGQHRGPQSTGARPFSEADAEAIRSQVPGVAGVAPLNQLQVVAAVGEKTWRTGVGGSNQDFLSVLNWKVGEGRFFDEAELLSGAEVCLLGRTPQTELFGARDPLGEKVRLDAFTCTVIGTLQPKGRSTFGQDQDELVVLPLRTYQRRFQGNRDIGTLYISAEAGVETGRLDTAISALMRQRRHIRPGAEDDFDVRDMAEIAAMLDSVSTVLTSFLAAVAAVSLVVGGIGIMNIMMVSVTERTREIGIRLAVGALARDVMLQFLVESVVLAFVGGIAGVVVGLLVSVGAARLLDVPLVVSPWVVLASFAFSGVVGIAFGWFPARRAARLRPIEALRHE